MQMSLAMIIVGSSVVCGKTINQVFPVFLASGLRFALAALIMIAPGACGGMARPPAFHPRPMAHRGAHGLLRPIHVHLPFAIGPALDLARWRRA